MNEFVKGPVQREHLCATHRANTSEKMREITRAGRGEIGSPTENLVSENAHGCPDKEDVGGFAGKFEK